MNLQHLKYVIEIANSGSINKAAEVLFMAQPNLSRAVRELESELGYTIFDRTSKGMIPTTEGAAFVTTARRILKEIDSIAEIGKQECSSKKSFSLIAPYASYISDAFVELVKCVGDENTEFTFKENPPLGVVKAMTAGEFKLGILRYYSAQENNTLHALSDKDFSYELITEFNYTVLMNAENPLAEKEEVSMVDLKSQSELIYGYVNSPTTVNHFMINDDAPKQDHRIFVYEKEVLLSLLSEKKDLYVWTAPMPEKLMKRYGLIQKRCTENKLFFKDILFYKKDYHLTELDKLFITELINSKRRCFDI